MIGFIFALNLNGSLVGFRVSSLDLSLNSSLRRNSVSRKYIVSRTNFKPKRRWEISPSLLVRFHLRVFRYMVYTLRKLTHAAVVREPQ